MAVVNVSNIQVLDNPAPFTQPLQFEITFQCSAELKDDLEWKVVYVGSAESTEHDQELESVLVGPVPVGTNKFILQTDAPNIDKIPKDDVIGVTVVLITCSYRGQEFVRVGYYVNNQYEVELPEDLSGVVLDPRKIIRNILSDKPRVTRFLIEW